MLRIELAGEDLFDADFLELNKKNTFILGKNGTGKSTLSKIIARDVLDYEVSVFDGFNNVIDANERLNAVVLGEENTSINKKIDEISAEITIKELEREAIYKTLTDPENSSISNYYSRLKEAEAEYNDLNNKIEKFYSQAAARIKNKKSMPTNYNKNSFRNDIKLANRLSDSELAQFDKTIKSEVKNAPIITFPSYDLAVLQEEINLILERKVIKKVRLDRIGDNQEKFEFAKKGFQLHKKGDVCTFCGSIINDNVFEELESYFSANEVEGFLDEIEHNINYIDNILGDLDSLSINAEDFYPVYQDEVRELKDLLDKQIKDYRTALNFFRNSLMVKKGELFAASDNISYDIPANFEDIKRRYIELCDTNNANDLKKKQAEAVDKLRYHYVQLELDDYNYSEAIGQLSILKGNLEDRKDEFNKEELKITGTDGLDSVIRKLNDDITELQNSTTSETLLATNINKKLYHMVSFELVPCKDEKSQGTYIVKDIYTGEKRNITELSTGEKNIIAFLYFMGKLKEVKEFRSNKPKLIVFDDPMNSNDDNMQYLIIEELTSLMKKLDADDKFILLTHNKHFYMNVTYGKDGVKRIHLLKDGQHTIFKEVTKNNDIKTSYEALWDELKFIYDSSASADMMLNPMRRIIETFTKFNALDQTDFCSKVAGAKKLFDVNSHSIDDFEADLNGKTKNDICLLFLDCFSENKCGEHFVKFWPELVQSTTTFNIENNVEVGA